MNAFDKLKQVSESKPKAKKSSARPVSDPEMQQACDTFVKASKELKNAEAEFKNSQEAVLDYMKPLHAKDIKDNDPATTYKLNESVMCIFTDRFSALKPEDVSTVKEACSKAGVDFKNLFKENVVLKLKENVSGNEKELAKLIDQLGELLPKYFEVSVNTVVVDDFDKAVAREGIYEQLSEVIERIRYKPTLRVS